MVEQVIICPKCGAKIPLSEAMTHQIRAELLKELEAPIAQREQRLTEKEKKLEEQSKSLDELVEKKLSDEREKIKKEAAQKAKDNVAIEVEDLNRQLKRNKKELQEMKKAELDLRRKSREIEEAKENLELEVVRKLDEERKRIKEELSKKFLEEHQLKDMEKNKTINDLNKKIEDLKRRAELGSQQLQGEVMELALEDILKANFPQDAIEAVPKGMRGADILQRVNEKIGQHSGTIIWESKRTQNWNDDWLIKLRNDQRQAKAEIAVVVSVALPKDVNNFANINGIWVSNYESVVGLATALRINLIRLAEAKLAAVGKQEKMEVLYNYLAGPEFKQRVEAVVESYMNMRKDLDKEKASMNRIWSKREKEMQRVIENISGMYGDMQGIIGISLPQIETLELRTLTQEPNKVGIGVKSKHLTNATNEATGITYEKIASLKK